MRRLLQWCVAGAFASCLLACATPVPAPPPILSLAGRTCDAQIALAGAVPLTLKPKDNVALDIVMGATSACLRAGGGAASAYSLVALPEWPEEYLVSVTSIPLGAALFSPRVQVLDAGGKVLREASRERFRFHGTSLQLGLRIRTGDRFLAILSDSATVGQTVSHVMSATLATQSSTGTATFMIYRGTESNVELAYAHSGRISVLADVIQKAE